MMGHDAIFNLLVGAAFVVVVIAAATRRSNPESAEIVAEVRGAGAFGAKLLAGVLLLMAAAGCFARYIPQ